MRAEGTQLTHALYQYIGPGIEPSLTDLKPVQVKELKEAFETLEKDGKGKGSLKPERLTRAAAREAEAREQDGGGGDDEPGAADEEGECHSCSYTTGIMNRPDQMLHQRIHECSRKKST